jgi:hypothetical protein
MKEDDPRDLLARLGKQFGPEMSGAEIYIFSNDGHI